jgi:hypothetical protein
MHGFLRTKSMNLPVFLLEWLSQQQPFTTWFSCDARRCYKGRLQVSGVWGVGTGPYGTGGRVREKEGVVKGLGTLRTRRP